MKDFVINSASLFLQFFFLELSVIIVNYNVRNFLEQCLCCVQAALEGLEAEVFVVDNHSNDGSVDSLKPVFPGVRFIENKENMGFGAANNQALQQCSGKYVLFLNPDTLMPEDCLKHCLQFIRFKPDAGALGIRMMDGSGHFLPESKRAFPSPMAAFYKLTGLAALYPKSPRFNRYSLGHLNPNKNHKVDVLAGAFMMVPKTVLDKVGGFDERFFMYGEDIDLSYRIQKAGYHNYYFAGSGILHFKGESTRKGSLNYVLLFYNAMRLFVVKNYRGGWAFWFRFFIQIAILLRGMISAFARIFHWVFRISSQKMLTGRRKNSEKTILLGDGDAEREILALFRNAGIHPGTLIHVLPDALDAPHSKPSANSYIFCASKNYSWKMILQQVRQLKDSGARFRFHSMGSKSIVGSDSKETRGERIVI